MHWASRTFHATAIEQAGESPSGRCHRSTGMPRRAAAGGGVLAAGEQAQRKRAPDAAQTVHRPCADRIVDAQEFEQIDAQDHDDAGDRAQDARTGRADPVAGAGDGHQTGEEAVGDDAASHFLMRKYMKNSAARPPVQAARVVLAEMRPMPPKSIADSDEPGLKPYQPNHRRNPPMTATVRSCGSMGPPPSRLNLRPILGPSMMPPARAIHPPIECTTVEPAKSWKFIPKFGRK